MLEAEERKRRVGREENDGSHKGGEKWGKDTPGLISQRRQRKKKWSSPPPHFPQMSKGRRKRRLHAQKTRTQDVPKKCLILIPGAYRKERKVIVAVKVEEEEEEEDITSDQPFIIVSLPSLYMLPAPALLQRRQGGQE